MRLTLLISVAILSLNSCNKTSGDRLKQDLIIEGLMRDAFDSLSQTYDFDDKFLVHAGVYPDVIITESIDRLRHHFRDDSLTIHNEDSKLLSALREIANDTFKVKKEDINLRKTKLFFVYNDSVFQSVDYFGSFTMTNIAFDESNKRCVFYLAINCGNHCSGGYIFFGDRGSDNKWNVKKFYTIWGDL